ncbi:MAG: glutaminase A [Oscillospiraceae bacterium]|nr:glutaminase A [Oscillospiraceae bacterium]
MEELLERLLEECRPFASQGQVANYIPELAKGDPQALGVYVTGSEGKHSWAGDCRRLFTIQSIVKPILLLQALLDNGPEFVLNRVGVEATGKPFDAINAGDQSLDSGNINPMVNMGAIVMCSLIHGRSYEERFQRLLDLTRRLAGDGEIGIDGAVYRSEKSHGSKNRALAYLLKSHGLLEDGVEEVLDCYFRACSIQMDCRALAHIGAVLANRGRLPVSNERIFPAPMSRYVNAILMTCGMYDGSGEFALRVGVPAKSGVGGGIMAVVPTRMGIGIFGPALDGKGNSVAGIKLLERLSGELFLSIF